MKQEFFTTNAELIQKIQEEGLLSDGEGLKRFKSTDFLYRRRALEVVMHANKKAKRGRKGKKPSMTGPIGYQNYSNSRKLYEVASRLLGHSENEVFIIFEAAESLEVLRSIINHPHGINTDRIQGEKSIKELSEKIRKELKEAGAVVETLGVNEKGLRGIERKAYISVANGYLDVLRNGAEGIGLTFGDTGFLEGQEFAGMSRELGGLYFDDITGGTYDEITKNINHAGVGIEALDITADQFEEIKQGSHLQEAKKQLDFIERAIPLGGRIPDEKKDHDYMLCPEHIEKVRFHLEQSGDTTEAKEAREDFDLLEEKAQLLTARRMFCDLKKEVIKKTSRPYYFRKDIKKITRSLGLSGKALDTLIGEEASTKEGQEKESLIAAILVLEILRDHEVEEDKVVLIEEIRTNLSKAGMTSNNVEEIVEQITNDPTQEIAILNAAGLLEFLGDPNTSTEKRHLQPIIMEHLSKFVERLFREPIDMNREEDKKRLAESMEQVYEVFENLDSHGKGVLRDRCVELITKNVKESLEVEVANIAAPSEFISEYERLREMIRECNVNVYWANAVVANIIFEGRKIYRSAEMIEPVDLTTAFDTKEKLKRMSSTYGLSEREKDSMDSDWALAICMKDIEGRFPERAEYVSKWGKDDYEERFLSTRERGVEFVNRQCKTEKGKTIPTKLKFGEKVRRWLNSFSNQCKTEKGKTIPDLEFRENVRRWMNFYDQFIPREAKVGNS